MTDDERRALYGRPSPDAARPLKPDAAVQPDAAMAAPAEDPRAVASLAEPAPPTETGPPAEPVPSAETVPSADPAPADDAQPTGAAALPADASGASARRRWALAAGAGLAAVALGAGAGAVLASGGPPPAGEPSLAVFDREPTEREREVEQLSENAGSAFGPAAVEARLLLSIALDEGGPREIWALRTEGVWLTPEQGALVCLTIDPSGVGGSGPLGCMLEDDLARRGFIPLEQPRPTVVIDGEIKVITWGPTGDARLTDPPNPPTDDEES